jgi:hypothetical protein
LTLGLVLAHPYVQSLNAPPVPFPLNASDVGGSLSISWESSHPAVKQAQMAVVEVHDADRIIRARLDGAAVRRGTFTHARQGADVLVTITMIRDSQPVATAMVRSVGP